MELGWLGFAARADQGKIRRGGFGEGWIKAQPRIRPDGRVSNKRLWKNRGSSYIWIAATRHIFASP